MTMRFFTSISLVFFATFLFGQEVDCARTASLTGANGYTNTGICTLERFDDGRVQLSMSEDFRVSFGPDLRIYLSNSGTSTGGGVELFLITDLLGANNFNGALTFELPSDINIEDFSHVVTYCKRFRQLWGSGEFSTFDCAGSDGGGGGGDSEDPQEEEEEVECFDSATATTAWVAEIMVCTDDGVPDPTELRTTLSEVTLGQDYSFLLTDANQNLQQVINEFEFDFDDTGLQTQLVFGIQYSGDLNFTIGRPISEITADVCFQLSSMANFLRVNKESCFVPDCNTSTVSTSTGQRTITVCTDDGIADNIGLRTSLPGIVLGQDYSFLVTDNNNILQAVVNSASFNFDNTGLETQRVFGISYQGDLNATIGRNISEITADCVQLSGSTAFLTVNKESCFVPPPECFESTVSTSTGQQTITVCTDDGIADPIGLTTSLSNVTLGQDYSFLVTDQNNILQAVVNSNTFDFDNTGLETQRVLGVHYQGTLNAVVGLSINQITADDCVQLSSGSVFITVNKESCVETFECLSSTVSSTSGGQQLTVCPTDGVSDVIGFTNSLSEAPGANYAYIISDDRDNISQVLTGDSFDFEGSGDGTLRVRGVHFDGTLQATVGSTVASITATGCAQVSAVFVTVNKGNCPAPATTRSVSGVITNPTGEALSNVTVTAGNRSVITDGQGRFSIDGLPTNVSLSINPTNNENAANGLSSLDIILVTRHILGIQSFTDPYQLIAADVNNNGSISAADLIGMQRVVLSLSSEFDGQPSWIYVPADADLSATSISNGVQTAITIGASEQDVQGLNFIGVKIGDLNDSASIE